MTIQRMFGTVALALAALGIGGCATPPDSPALSEASSTSGLGALRSQVEERVSQGRYPGAVYAVARGGSLLAIEAVGAADVETQAPMRADSIFRTMSMTKPVTAAAAMILVQEGKLDLDAPVSRVLPEFAAFGVPGAPPLTARHLLTHTSGIGFGSIPTKRVTLAEHVRGIAARPMKVPAGSEWAYSGFDGPDVVARMIEVIAGEPYDRFVKRRIFDPLGMKDTGYSLDPAQQQRLVGLHAAKDGSIIKSPPLLPDPSYPSGGAGLFSTAADYLRFARMLAGDGALDEIRVLTPRSVAEIRRAQLVAGFPGLAPGLEWGLLVRRLADPAAAKSPLPVGAYGWSGAYGTHFWVDPATGLAAVWMINLSTAGGAASPDALDFEQMVAAACRTDRRCAAR